MSQAVASSAGKPRPEAGPLKHVVGEFKNFFTDLYSKLESYEATGTWPESKVLPKTGKKGLATTRKPRGKTPHNLFIKEAIAAARAKNEIPAGNNYLMMAQEKWRALSKEEQTAYATSKKDEIAQINASLGQEASELDQLVSSPAEDDEPEAPSGPTLVVPVPTSPSKVPKTDKKRKLVEAADQAEDGTEKKKKKKKKKSVLPTVEA